MSLFPWPPDLPDLPDLNETRITHYDQKKNYNEYKKCKLRLFQSYNGDIGQKLF